MTSIFIPANIKKIYPGAFQGCIKMDYYDFSTHTSVPTIYLETFAYIPDDCEIRVPAALYDEWIAASIVWSDLADHIVAV